MSLSPFHSQSAHQAGEARDHLLFKAERLAHFARGRAAAIGDDVGGHGRAECTVVLVAILDHLFALIAGGKIEIDIGPFTATLAQESLEQKFHADRIDCCNFKRVADSGVGCRTAALHQNSVLLAIADEVPHDEEVSGKAELRNELELVLHLGFGFFKQVSFGRIAVAFAHAFIHALGQKAVHGFACGHGIMRKLVAKIVEREVEALTHNAGVGDGFGNVAEERRHLAARAQQPLRVRSKQTACLVECGVVANCREYVEQLAVGFRCIANAVGGNHRQAQRRGQRTAAPGCGTPVRAGRGAAVRDRNARGRRWP